METIINAKNIQKKRGDITVLDRLDISLYSTESMVVTGKSGSGKSTLLNILGMIESFDHGKLELFGEDTSGISKFKKRQLYRDDIGFMFQDFGLIQEQTVEENLYNSIYYRDSKSEEKKQRIKDALNIFSLYNKLKCPIEILSGGEKQRVAILKLILKKPKLILADEPTGSLDKDNRDEVIKELFKLSSKGSALVIVTHDLEIAEMADKRLELGKGRL